MRFRHFVKDFGNYASQPPAFLYLNTDRFRQRFRRVEVIQIRHVGFRTVFLDRFPHGQFFKRLAEIKHLVAIRHFGFAQHRLRQGAEQRLGQFDQVFVVRIRHI